MSAVTSYRKAAFVYVLRALQRKAVGLRQKRERRMPKQVVWGFSVLTRGMQMHRHTLDFLVTC